MTTSTPSARQNSVADNPLLAPWTGPYGGVPPFDRATARHLQPALEAGMAAQLKEIEAIAADPAPATFENTIAAMERTGRLLERVNAVYGVYTSTLNDAAVQAIEREMAPRLAAFSDEITQNTALFTRIAKVYETREQSGLDPEQQRLTWLYYTDFVRAGAQLDAVAKRRLSAINQRLAALFTQFSQNILGEEDSQALILKDASDLDGLPESVRTGAAVEAERRGHKGCWAISNTRSSVEPFLAFSTRRDLREQVWRTFVHRGDNNDARDNKGLVTEILALRAERAQLLGFDTHAHWRLDNQMAKTPERALDLMLALWTPAVARVAEEVADMQALADSGGHEIEIEPWDYRFYAELVRKQKFDLDAGAVKPYLQLEKLREALFFVAHRLFGLRFTPVDPAQVPVCHPDVRVWEVKNDRGQHVGLWYFDPYARQGKLSGAWMSEYRRQHRFDGETSPIVSNNANFVPGRPGEPVLVSWEDATTLFHEFGHALHGLMSNVNYPSLSGTYVPRDFVEFPSQLLEHWLATPEVLARYALHFETGEPIPADLVARIERARTFNQGFGTVEYLASALIDMKLHLEGLKPIDPGAFERETLASLAMPREIVMRHRTPQFNHVFSGDGYSAGYYSYLWADTLTADAWEAFTEGRGPWDLTVAERLKEQVFTRGNTQDPLIAYQAFRGREPGVAALMRKRGFPA
ncbi:MAG: M3 family metallopeptidase [Steroidobacteraceae bacterium]